MVTKLLSRAEMLSNPKALEAIRAEADGLVKAGTWDLSSVREKEDVRKEAKASGVSVHFGQLMTIASIKFYELADHLHKMNARIVYRGDCANTVQQPSIKSSALILPPSKGSTPA